MYALLPHSETVHRGNAVSVLGLLGLLQADLFEAITQFVCFLCLFLICKLYIINLITT